MFEEPLGTKETVDHAVFEHNNRNFFWAQIIIKLNLIEIMEKNVKSFETFRDCLDDQYLTEEADQQDSVLGMYYVLLKNRSKREIIFF